MTESILIQSDRIEGLKDKKLTEITFEDVKSMLPTRSYEKLDVEIIVRNKEGGSTLFLKVKNQILIKR